MCRIVLFFVMQLQKVVVCKVFTFSVPNYLFGTGKEHRISRQNDTCVYHKYETLNVTCIYTNILKYKI